MAPARKVRAFACDDSFRSSAGKVIWTRFEEMMSFSEVALAGEDIEGVHDMRVASRRLRAALEIFADVFPRKRLRPMLRQVKDLADALGRVRDLDVMIERVEHDYRSRTSAQRAALGEMVRDLHEQRTGARKDLALALESLERDDFPRRFMAFVARETI